MAKTGVQTNANARPNNGSIPAQPERVPPAKPAGRAWFIAVLLAVAAVAGVSFYSAQRSEQEVRGLRQALEGVQAANRTRLDEQDVLSSALRNWIADRKQDVPREQALVAEQRAQVAELKEQLAEQRRLATEMKSFAQEAAAGQVPPRFVFHGLTVPWERLVRPEVVQQYPQLARKVIGTFPVACAYGGSNLAGVVANAQEITFPRPGSYYLRTTLGNFKLLILDDKRSADDNALELCAFVSGNHAHSTADHATFENDLGRRGELRLYGKLFRSDQPLLLYCFQITEIGCDLLKREGLRTRQVFLEFKAGHPGWESHWVLEVFLPVRQKWALVDLDHGYMVTDAQGTPLSIMDIAAQKPEEAANLVPKRLVELHALKDDFNLDNYTPSFAWTPDKGLDSPVISAASTSFPGYRAIVKDWVDSFWIRDFLGLHREPPWQKFTASGARHPDDTPDTAESLSPFIKSQPQRIFDALLLDPSQIRYLSGKCYVYDMRHLAGEADDATHPLRSDWQLMTGDKVYRLAHTPVEDIRRLGQGRWCHWGDNIFFSTSDGSDPRTNGRKYRLVKSVD